MKSYTVGPDGYYGQFGGAYVPEILYGTLKALQEQYEKIIDRDMDGLISRFREDYPTFKNIDYLLFCFIVAGYDAKTISILLTERSPYSIHTRKSRLKKVIAESDVKNKEEYLKYF